MCCPSDRAQQRARGIVAAALRDGRLVMPVACEVCRAERVANPPVRRGKLRSRPSMVLHHHDYAKPLDVIPLCNGCHSKVHHGLIPEPRTGRIYRSWSTERAKQRA